MSLTPGRLDLIRQALEDELRKACRDALDRGVPPAAVEAAIADRRRALAPQHPADDVGDRVAQQHE